MLRRLAPLVVAVVVTALVVAACGSGSDAPDPEAVSAGAGIYASNCASCHGVDGAGGQGPALLDSAAVADMSDDELAALIAGGRVAMPAFADRLSEAEIASVVAFLRGGLGKDADPTTTAGGAGGRGELSGLPPEVADATAEDWPLANRDYSGSRAVVDSPITSETIGDLEVAWEYEAPGSGTFGNLTTTPLVVGDTVYVGDLQTRVHAIDRETGEERFVSGEEAAIFGPTGVGIGYGRLYGTSGNDAGRGTEVVAYDAESGEELWATDISANGGEINMQPVVFDGLVLAATSGYGAGTRATIYALDAETGTIVWDFDVIEDDDLWGNPDLNSGGGVWYPPTIDAERRIAYFGTGNPYPFPGSEGFPNGSSRPGDNKWTDSALALDIDTGELVWGHQAIAHDIFDRDAMQTGRLDVEIDGEQRALTLSTGKLGVLMGLDADTGEELWSTEVGTHQNDDLTEIDGPTEVFPGSLGGVQTPIAHAEGTVYLPIVNAPTTYEGPEATSYGFGVELGSHPGQMVAVDAATGEIEWDVELPGDVLGGATVVGDLVLTSTFDGVVLALSRADGHEVWRYEADAGINGWPAVSGDMLLIPVGMGDPAKVVALRLPEG